MIREFHQIDLSRRNSFGVGQQAARLAEFETEHSTWTDKEALLKSGFGMIEDIVDGKLFLFLSSSCRLPIKPALISDF